jgi:hypothetical protein
MLQNVDETFWKNVESNIFSPKMLIELLKNVGSTFSLKNVTTFFKNVETFCYAWVNGKIKTEN